MNLPDGREDIDDVFSARLRAAIETHYGKAFRLFSISRQTRSVSQLDTFIDDQADVAHEILSRCSDTICKQRHGNEMRWRHHTS
jgi:hypothetical protein